MIIFYTTLCQQRQTKVEAPTVYRLHLPQGNFDNSCTMHSLKQKYFMKIQISILT